MPSFHHGLISRSSSATLSASRPQDIVFDGTFEDMVIAQELLNQPRVLQRQTSLAGIFSNSLELQIPHNQLEYDGSNEEKRSRRALQSSNTWTTSSGGEMLSDHDEIEDRTLFVAEYNRIAQKHGIRAMVPEDHDVNDDSFNVSMKSSWFSRKFLRRTSSNQSAKPEKHVKHRRSISDLSLRLKYAKKDTLKDKDLQELVRLCGLSLIYLPAEYAPGSLAVPTCFRATAQYLIQHAPSSRGVFRIPGSHNVVAALYAHYCNKDSDGEMISGTVHCPSIPGHIKCDVHDVASAFKKFLSGLPGGILGSLALFDALVAIQSQLQGDPELTRTKQSKVRARLIALAISTSQSQYRRDLICAVFGLLCMIGRAAETTRRENEHGRPLPTSDLMGYTALGIVFGPLLVGELLENSSMHIANPHRGLVLLPISPPKSRKEKHRKRSSIDQGIYFDTHVDKLKVANSITEMVITHWRDVVRHIKNIGASKVIGGHKSSSFKISKPSFLRPSASDTFALRKPPDWDDSKSPIRRMERSNSPTPIRRVSVAMSNKTESCRGSATESPHDSLVVRKQRSRLRRMSNQILSGKKSTGALSPTVEERLSEKSVDSPEKHARWTENNLNPVSSTAIENILSILPPPSPPFPLIKTPPAHTNGMKEKSSSRDHEKLVGSAQSDSSHHKKRKLTKSPKSVTKKHKEHSKSSEKSSESLGVIIRNQVTASARKVVGKPAETPVKTVEHINSAPKTHEGHQHYFHSPTRQGSKPPDSPCSILQAPNSNTRVGTQNVVVPEGTVSARIKRFAASEPGQIPSGLRIPDVRRLSKTTYGDTTRRNWANSQRFATKDPLSSISHVEDEASLAALARAMESEDTSTKVHGSPVEKQHHSKHHHSKHQQDHCVSQAAVAHTMQSEDNTTSKKDLASRISRGEQLSSPTEPALAYPESSTGSGDPYNVQNTSSSIPAATRSPTDPPAASFLLHMATADNSRAPVCPILGSQMPSDDPGPRTPSLSKTPRAHRSARSRPAIRPRRSSVKALAAKFDKTESPPTITSSPAKSLAKSTISTTQSNQSPRKNSMVAQYTRNTPSPAKSHKSARSDKTPGSVPTVQAERHLEFGYKLNVEPMSSPAKNASPRRILKSSLHDSTPLRRVERSVESIKRTPSFTVNATNPFAVSLKPITSASLTDRPQDGLYDGPSSTSMIDGSYAASERPPVVQHSELSRRTSQGTISTEGLHPQPLNISRSVSGRPLESQRAQGSWLTSTSSSTPSTDGYHDISQSPSGQQHAQSSPGTLSQAIGVAQDSPGQPLQSPKSPEQLLENDPILSRYDTSLHPQFMTLQDHVSRKNEKIHQLKQQLNSKDSVDVDVLSKELKNTKKELRTWKMRAEAAERKLEQLYEALADSRPNSIRPPIGDLQSSDDCDNPSNDSDRMCNVLHGMDGAGGSEGRSEESNGTVIREINSSESEYIALWDQTMNELIHQKLERGEVLG